RQADTFLHPMRTALDMSCRGGPSQENCAPRCQRLRFHLAARPTARACGDVGLFRLTETHSQIRRVLPEISIRTVDIKFLPDAIRKNFDFGSDSALVVGQTFEIEP